MRIRAMVSEDAPHPPAPFSISLAAVGVLALGLAARLWLYVRIPLISTDGYVYIQQAKALHFGYTDQLLSCFPYLSPYSIAVSAAYSVVGDWVQAAQLVNILLSTLSILPLYWLLRRFFRDDVACTTLLIFALLPNWVWVGRDALRGPLFWAFGLMGLYLFVLNLEQRRPWLLILASLSMGLAAWARVEGLLYITVSPVFLVFSSTRYRRGLLDAGLFLSPYLLILAVGLVLSHLRGQDVLDLLQPERVWDYVKGLFYQYHGFRDLLKTLHPPGNSDLSPYFFSRIRSLLWAIPLLSLVVLIFETLLYVFGLLLIAGMVSWARKTFRDRRIAYLAILSLLAFVLLYFFTLYLWYSDSRQLSVFLFPAAVFMGAGVEALSAWLSAHLRWKPAAGYAVVCALVLLIFVPKIGMAKYDRDKRIYLDIGRCIAQHETGPHAIEVCGSFKAINTIHFYANLNLPAPSCFDRKGIFQGGDLKTLATRLHSGYRYFVWNEAGWDGTDPDRIHLEPGCRLERIKTWDSRKHGKFILFEAIK